MQGDRRRSIDAGIAAGLFALTLACSIVRIGYPPEYVWDEHVYVPGALALAGGQDYPFDGAADLGRFGTGRSSWMHPPLAKYAMAIVASEDAPLDARYVSAIASAIAVALVYLIAIRLRADRGAALFASAFFALDGARYVLSRVAILESLLVAIVLGAALALVHALEVRPETRKRRISLAAFGVLAGLAIGTKWSGAAIWACGSAFVWAEHVLAKPPASRAHRPVAETRGEIAWLALTTLAIPALVFGGLYAPYLLHGHSSGEVLGLWGAMYRAQQGYAKERDDAMTFLAWPFWVRPMRFAMSRTDVTRVIELVPNAIVWWSAVPAACGVLAMRVQRDSAERSASFVAACVFAFWLPWALASRTTYPYYFFPALPFGCLCVAVVLADLRPATGRVIGAALLAIAALWFAWFTPSYFGSSPVRSGPFETPRGNPTWWSEP